MIGVGSPAILHLNRFGAIVSDAFRTTAYLVGSAAVSKDWRDVDVRVILPDSLFRRLFGDPFGPYHLMPAWASVCMAYSALGSQMTGLPIDFQPMPQMKADDLFKDHPRIELR